MAKAKAKRSYPIVETKNKRLRPADLRKTKVARPKVKKTPQPPYPSDVPEGQHAVWDGTEAVWHYHRVDPDGRYTIGGGKTKDSEAISFLIKYKHTKHIAEFVKEAKRIHGKKATMSSFINTAIDYFLEHTTKQEQLELFPDKQGAK